MSAPEMPPIRVAHRIVIELDEGSGSFKVEGAPQNQVIALGMLKLAENAVLSTLAPPKPTSKHRK